MSAQRFRVGQPALLVLSRETGFASRNGETVIVTAPKRFGAWDCGAPDRPDLGTGICHDERYEVVMCNGNRMRVTEYMLRPWTDEPPTSHRRKRIRRPRLSTWQKFREATGIDLLTAVAKGGVR